MNGGKFKDQLAPVSHLPPTLLVQLFVRPAAATNRLGENSLVRLVVAVAVRIVPGVSGGQLMAKLPVPSAVMLVEVSNDLPSPKPDWSAVGLVNNSSRKA